MTAFEGLLLALAIVTLFRGLHLARLEQRIGRLPEGPPTADAELPSLSLVVAARNEERHVEEAVRSWLAVAVPRLQVIVVDDRSTDGTPAILERLAEQDSRLMHVRLERRPADWLGKCHALSTGARAATGEYLLFSDADVVLDAEGVRRALAFAAREDLDHLTLLPRTHVRNLVQEGLTWYFFQLFLTLAGGLGLNRDDGRGAVGVGAFNLVRHAAYEAVGGHEPIRLQVGDDVALARLLVRSGFRHRVRFGFDVAELEWQPGVLGTVKGLEKNGFWGLRFSWLALGVGTLVGLAHLLPMLGLFLGTTPGLAAAGVWAAGILLSYRLPDTTWPRRLACALLHPLSVLLLQAAAWNSAVATARRGGICWRDDFFSLEQLREALLPVSWWVGGPEARPPSRAAIEKPAPRLPVSRARVDSTAPVGEK